MIGSSYNSVLVEGVTYIDEREIIKRDAEIERLRALIRDLWRYAGTDTPGGYAEAAALRDRVREALGERDD